jgi:hypothetical protein
MLIAVLAVGVVDAAVVGALVHHGVRALPVIGALVAFTAAQLLVGPRCALAALRARRVNRRRGR